MQSGCKTGADLGIGHPVGRERRGGHLGRRALHTACRSSVVGSGAAPSLSLSLSLSLMREGPSEEGRWPG